MKRKHTLFLSAIVGMFLVFFGCTQAIAQWQRNAPEREMQDLQEQKTQQLLDLMQYREDAEEAKVILDDARSVLQSAQEAFDSAQAKVEAQRTQIARTERMITSLVDPLSVDSSSQ